MRRGKRTTEDEPAPDEPLPLREAREQAGVTQEKLARITKTKKSAISRLENHAEDVRLSTVSRVARALGKAVRIELVEAT